MPGILILFLRGLSPHEKCSAAEMSFNCHSIAIREEFSQNGSSKNPTKTIHFSCHLSGWAEEDGRHLSQRGAGAQRVAIMGSGLEGSSKIEVSMGKRMMNHPFFGPIQTMFAGPG